MAPVTQQPQMGLAFEQVWAALMETRECIDKVSGHVDKVSGHVDKVSGHVDKISGHVDKIGEYVDKVGERLDKVGERLDKVGERLDKVGEHVDKMSAKVDRVSENVGGVNRSMGELIEILFAAKLWEKFKNFPYEFKMAYQRIPVYNDKKEELTDIDILLVNGDYAMVVEVKRYLKKDDIDHHLIRMERLRKYQQKLTEGKKLVGALAAGVAGKDERDYAFENGFFVLELTGESVELVPSPPEFKPREW